MGHLPFPTLFPLELVLLPPPHCIFISSTYFLISFFSLISLPRSQMLPVAKALTAGSGVGG